MKSVFQFLSLLFCQNNVIGEYSEFVNTYGEQIINISNTTNLEFVLLQLAVGSPKSI